MDEADRVLGKAHELLDKAVETPARTPEGWSAKARLMKTYMHWVGIDQDEYCSPDVRLAKSLVRDLVGQASA